MSIYRFSLASPVRDITFRYADDRPPEALISAAPSADGEQLSIIRRALEAQGWLAVPALAEGKQVLQAGGFRDEGQLVALLMTQAFAKGNPKIEAEAGDHPTLSFRDWLQDNSIRAGGVLNLIGDGALLASGAMGGRSNEALAGGLYTAGGLIAARYGNVKTEYHLRQVSERIAEQLREQAGALPEDCGLYNILKAKRDGTLNHVEDLLYRYPSQTTLGVYTLGALAMLQSGLKHGNVWDTAYGANSVATKTAALFIPEEPKERLSEKEKKEHEAHGPLLRLYDWIREKPLRIFGYGSMVSDALLGLSALREYHADPRQKSYIFKFVTTGTYMLADMMFAISSKGPGADGKFDAQEQRRLEALAAETIAAQAKALQEPLINQIAGYLSTQPEINGTAPELAKSITQQVEAMKQNPWACRMANGRCQDQSTSHASL